MTDALEDADRTEREIVRLGAEVEQALAVLDTYFDRLRAAAHKEWAETSPDRTDRLARLHMTGHIVNGLQAAMRQAVVDGQSAASMTNYRVLLAEHGLATR